MNVNTRIAEITARAQAATPGPWEQHRPSGEYVHNPETSFNVCMTRRGYDAEFIAHARQDIPFLLSLIRQVTKERDAYKRVKDYWGSLYGLGLEVANWHLNGDTEPFDEFWESAEEEFNNEPEVQGGQHNAKTI